MPRGSVETCSSANADYFGAIGCITPSNPAAGRVVGAGLAFAPESAFGGMLAPLIGVSGCICRMPLVGVAPFDGAGIALVERDAFGVVPLFVAPLVAVTFVVAPFVAAAFAVAPFVPLRAAS